MPCWAARSETKVHDGSRSLVTVKFKQRTTSEPTVGSSSTTPLAGLNPRKNVPKFSSACMASSRLPSVNVMLIEFVTSKPKKSESENWTLRLAPRHRSIASNTVDLPLSPGPIRQLMPGVGHQLKL